MDEDTEGKSRQAAEDNVQNLSHIFGTLRLLSLK